MEQVEKRSVGYEHPAKGPNHCSQCRHFIRAHGCEIVRGHIDPGDWCRRFKAKRNSDVFYDHKG